MMKRKYSFMIVNILGVCIMIAGCAKLPEQEISVARTAYESARVAKAPVFAADQFKAAEALLITALADIKMQRNTKSVFAYNYDKPRKTLVDAAAGFEASKTTSIANEASIDQENRELFTMAKTSIRESQKIATILMKSKNREAVILKKKLDAISASLPANPGTLADSALIVSRDTMRSTLASAESVKTSLEQLFVVTLTSEIHKPIDKNDKVRGKIRGRKGRR
jgi:hypothetical protein